MMRTTVWGAIARPCSFTDEATRICIIDELERLIAANGIASQGRQNLTPGGGGFFGTNQMGLSDHPPHTFKLHLANNHG